jgi:hypothetical protein
MRWPAALPGRSLEAGGNAGPRGMFAAAGKATTRRDRTRLTGRLWPFSSFHSVRARLLTRTHPFSSNTTAGPSSEGKASLSTV